MVCVGKVLDHPKARALSARSSGAVGASTHERTVLVDAHPQTWRSHEPARGSQAGGLGTPAGDGRRTTMPENNPATGQPYGGLNKKQDDSLPGEREVEGEVEGGEGRVGPPPSRGNEGETGSRAARNEPMASDTDGLEPTPGIPGRVEPP